MTTKEIFSQRMRELRKQTGQPQKVLAELLDVSVNQISEMEKGTRMTTLEKLAVICQHYNVSADYLLVDQDNVFETYGRVNSDGVNVRAAASTDSGVAATLSKDTYLTVNGFTDGWYSVTCKYGTEGYIRSDFLVLTNSSSSSSDIVSLAKQ